MEETGKRVGNEAERVFLSAELKSRYGWHRQSRSGQAGIPGKE